MIFGDLLRRLVAIDKPATNLFPAKYMPKSITNFLSEVQSGTKQLNPPIELPKDFRGKISYEKEKCIGCQQCIRVCPSKAIKYKEDEEKIKIYVSRCTFCSLCNDICPVDCLHMSEEQFLLADEDKFSDNLIVENSDGE